MKLLYKGEKSIHYTQVLEVCLRGNDIIIFLPRQMCIEIGDDLITLKPTPDNEYLKNQIQPPFVLDKVFIINDREYHFLIETKNIAKQKEKLFEYLFSNFKIFLE